MKTIFTLGFVFFILISNAQNNTLLRYGLNVNKNRHAVKYNETVTETKTIDPHIASTKRTVEIEEEIIDANGNKQTITTTKEYNATDVYSVSIKRKELKDFYWKKLHKDWMKANIVQKKDTLYVNWWLQPAVPRRGSDMFGGDVTSTPKRVAKRSKTISENWTEKFPEANKRSELFNSSTYTILSKEDMKDSTKLKTLAETGNYFSVQRWQGDGGWFRNDYYDPSMVQVKKPDGKTTFEKRQAFILIGNRQVVRFRYSHYEMGALTVPFKMRFGYSKEFEIDKTKQSISVKAETHTDVNLGAYYGFTLGNIGYRYRDKEEAIAPTQRYWTLASFVSLSTIKLDSASTSAAYQAAVSGMGGKPAEPAKRDYLGYEATRPAFTGGAAFLVGIRDLRLGVFVGWDFPFGEHATKWNYYAKPWLGFGLGYNLGFIRKV